MIDFVSISFMERTNMSQAVSKKFRALLLNEIAKWQAEGLIDSQTAGKLIDLYPEISGKNNLITILLVLGAVLIGLGVLLFIGSNWEHMGKVAKVILIFVAVILSNYWGFRNRFEPGNRPKLGSALLLLGSLIYGAGIWLISQIFNLDIDPSSGLMMWSCGAAVMAFATRDVSIACLTSIVITSFALNASGWWSFFGGNTPTPPNYPLVLAMFSISVVLNYYVVSPWAMILTILGAGLWISTQSELTGILAYGICLFAIYLCHRRQWQIFSNAFLYMSIIISLFALFLETFFQGNRYHDPHEMHIVITRTLEFATLFTVPCVAMKYREFLPELYAAAVVLLISAIAKMCPEAWGLGLANANLAFAALGLIATGVNKLKSATIVNITLVFVVLDIISRYFDTFFKMFDRSLVFVIGGFLLLIIGSYIETTRRKLLGSIKA
jgi:uncharacterized membrane protein